MKKQLAVWIISGDCATRGLGIGVDEFGSGGVGEWEIYKSIEQDDRSNFKYTSSFAKARCIFFACLAHFSIH
jgi:hypothetical protein